MTKPSGFDAVAHRTIHRELIRATAAGLIIAATLTWAIFGP